MEGKEEEEIRTLTPLKRNKTEGWGRAEMGKFPNLSLVWSILVFG